MTSRARPPRVRALSTVTAAILAAFLAGCSPSGSRLPAGPVTIGLVTSRTGIDLGLGVDVELGARQAVDEVNASGGVDGHQVRLVVADDGSTGAGAADGYTTLLKGKAAGVIGPLEPESALAVTAAAVRRKTPLLLTTGADPLTRAGKGVVPNVFLAAPAAGRAADAMLAYARKAGWTSVAVAHPSSGDAYADAGVKEMAGTATRAHLKISDQPFDPATVDFTQLLAAARASGAQALVAWGGGSGPPILERMWAAAGLGIPILLSPESATTSFRLAVADSGEGALIATTDSVLSPSLPAASPVHKQVDPMATAFERANGYYPSQAAFDGYGAARLLLRAIGDAGSADPAVVDAALSQLRLSTAAGTYSFSAGDHLGLPASWLVVAKVTGGKLVPST